MITNDIEYEFDLMLIKTYSLNEYKPGLSSSLAKAVEEHENQMPSLKEIEEGLESGELKDAITKILAEQNSYPTSL